MFQCEEDTAIEQWKLRRLIKSLDASSGAGTSAITLIVRSGQDITLTNQKVKEELGEATNIKSRVNRGSVRSALTSIQQRLKRYGKTPKNGPVIFCGEMSNEDGREKEKKVFIDFEPFKPISRSHYLCDSRFHTEYLAKLLEDDDKFGFLIMDGNGSLFGTLQGNYKEVLHKFNVDLPKKHGRGGQSALRFARLRLEKRHNYVGKVGELATQFFISGDRPNIKGLIVAGSAELKSDLTTNTDLFDLRLAAILIPPLLDISYGGEPGFNQAIELAAERMANVKIIQEKKVISKFLDEVAQDTGKSCFGIKDVIHALETGAVETLTVWENLEMERLSICNPHRGNRQILYLTPEEAKNHDLYRDKDSGVELDIESEPFLEWIVDTCRGFGAKLQFVSDRSNEGHQFCKGFGGVGGLLRYRVDFEVFNDVASVDSDDEFM
mmetsp:Transcript_77199/g.153086  ORF Transcript_77199/g.153086 Transcript_77199/m.153086 type:complete len:437 (-) Transcript_77199:390-1700(-)